MTETLCKHCWRRNIEGLRMNLQIRSADRNEYPFKFKLEVASTERLMESYTGVYIIVHVMQFSGIS